MNFPDNLKYTKEHEWIRVEGDEAVIGITEFATSELGDVVFIEIETVGETLAQDETFGTIEAVKTVSDLFMPVAGQVLEMNSILEDNPEIVNKEPYTEGWLIKIKIENPEEIDSLLSKEDYEALVS
jgi:glycine cleavage system H protein